MRARVLSICAFFAALVTAICLADALQNSGTFTANWRIGEHDSESVEKTIGANDDLGNSFC